MSELANYIQLVDGVQKWLVISNPRVIKKTIVDPLDNVRKELNVRRFTVTREDRQFVNKTLDVTSVKFDTQLMRLWNLGAMDRTEIGITSYGDGFTRQYVIASRPIQT